jgi:hypothetical protein
MTERGGNVEPPRPFVSIQCLEKAEIASFDSRWFGSELGNRVREVSVSFSFDTPTSALVPG